MLLVPILLGEDITGIELSWDVPKGHFPVGNGIPDGHLLHVKVAETLGDGSRGTPIDGASIIVECTDGVLGLW
jgi:hypothetical protein